MLNLRQIFQLFSHYAWAFYNDLIKLFPNLYLVKLLVTSANPFYPCRRIRIISKVFYTWRYCVGNLRV